MDDIQHESNRATKPESHRAGRGTESCILCGRSGDLQASHIIPKFVGKWFKNTSATGAMLNVTPQQSVRPDDQKIAASDYAKLVQDLPTYKMLCGECEQRFSKLEKPFADKIFYPFHNNGAKRLEYGNWLEPFAVSLAWRVLKYGHGLFKSRYPDLITHVERAEASWRKSLLGDAWTAPPYESNILFLDGVAGTGAASKKFDWYMLRSIECGIDCQFGRVFTYAKLPGMVFVTAIVPSVLKDWQGARIGESGVLADQHRAKVDSTFWQYLLTRDHSDGGWLDAPVPRVSQEVLAERQRRALQKDRTRFLESDTIKIATDQMVSRYKQKMASMPPLVIELVDVIRNQVAGTEAETVDNIWRSRKIFDALAGLSAEEAAKLDSGIHNAIDRMKATDHSAKYRLTANTIRITFIANHNSTKADQDAALAKERAEMEVERSNDEIPFAIFSMNYEDDGVSFESEFMVPPDRASQTS